MNLFERRDYRFDIDEYINPWIPPNQTSRLPTPISRFLGYRSPSQEGEEEVGVLLVAWWSLFGAFCGIAAVSATFKYGGIFSNADVDTPIIIGSFGAAAILEYGVVKSPLAQPRNCILGHFISAVSGICVTKIFKHSDHFEDIRWLAGALAVGIASAVMTLTNTSHPPGGATALLAAVDPGARGMGWYLLPYILIGNSIFICIALVVNNIQRRFPVFWWTAKETGSRLSSALKKSDDLEGQPVIINTDGDGLIGKSTSDKSLSTTREQALANVI
ncbi:hypothetical protein AA313_de0202594 [Arthrobotrys entomopaga]|nr:hypothetical protein AA313_de0202594 [Arthrobotrys entomopaga]